jgi:hypothetical protein
MIENENEPNVTTAKNYGNISELSTKPMSKESDLELINGYEDGLACLLTRVKQTIQSTKEAHLFLKTRAKLEEDHAKALLKLCQSSTKTDGKLGLYAASFQGILKIHQKIAELKMASSLNINVISENIYILARNTERSRKQLKEASNKSYKDVTDSEALLEKVLC